MKITMNQQINNLLRKLQGANRYVQCAELQDIAAAIQNASKTDLKELLELLNTTHDIELQVKLFSLLSGYLLSKNVNCDVIITCKPLYDKIQDVLNKGLPLRTTTTLNLILALLSFDAEEKQASLAIFARNMIRVSGCLSNMSSLLTSSMMYQDTWIALCHSLAKACRHSEVNQSYCSHLVPFCVQSCLQGNVEVFCVLQSLLHNHERNIQLFLETNGVSIFTREFLQHETCMQLLNTIVQKSSQAISILRTTNVLNDLRDLQRLSGPFSQIGQWSTIILYHLNCGINKKEEIVTEPDVVIADNVNKTNSNQNKEDTIFRNVSIRPEFEETKNLFQNVIKEVLQFNSKNNCNNFKIPHIPNSVKKDTIKRSHSLQRNYMSYFLNNEHKTQYTEKEHVYPKQNGHRLQQDKNKSILTKDLSCSFLFEQNHQQSNINSNNEIKDIHLRNCNLENNGFLKTNSNASKLAVTMRDSCYANNRADTSDFYTTIIIERKGDEKYSDIDLREFKPTFMSTPKRLIVKKQNIKIQSRCLLKNDSKICKQKRHKTPSVEKTKQRSISARLFNAVNESCTTFVKSVKSIFKAKENTNNTQNEMINLNTEAENEENLTCSYSFTDYMRKRDAILAGNCTETNIYNDFSLDMRKNSCKTCNDTIILRNKLDNNEHLKKTMMKLKLGINLYGCDFRKISKVMWPRERYMTPKVLNNLYRKLILKK